LTVLAGAQSLTNKTLTDSTNDVIARGLWDSSGASSVSVYAATAPTTGQVLTASNSTTAIWSTPVSAPTTFSDSTFTVYNNSDNTKITKFNDSGSTTGTTTTLATTSTTSKTLTLPNFNDTLTVLAGAQTLTNKTMTDNTNNVIARQLWGASGASSVSVYAATAPTTGQVLTASNSTTAIWSTPSGGSTSAAQANYVATSESLPVANSSYQTLTTGQVITITTGTIALVTLSARMTSTSSGSYCSMGFSISGATTLAASDQNSASVIASTNAGTYFGYGTVSLVITGLTAGSNIFTARFANSGGIGTYANRTICVVPLN
jgi:hypothetical protein